MPFEVGAPAHAGQIVVDALVRENVKRLYCLPGSHLLQFYDALREAPSIGLVTCKQEPNASLMADAYGRFTGEPGVCLLTAGPGGANSIAGVAQAYGAASPMVHITGSVPLDASREAFHGVDDPDFLVEMFGKVTKWSVRVKRMEDISGVMARAFHVARSGRPGPVHVEIPRLSDYSPHLLQDAPIALPRICAAADAGRRSQCGGRRPVRPEIIGGEIPRHLRGQGGDAKRGDGRTCAYRR